MKYIIGIGNIEKQYEHTRHNIGFKVVDHLKSRPGSLSRKAEWGDERGVRAFVARFNSEVLLVKPKLFVNRTGITVSEIVGGNPEAASRDFLFVCDDVNLPFGKLRLRAIGSAGGHHGLESVIPILGTEDFPRLRIGIGRQEMPRDLVPFVLGRFDFDEEAEIPEILEKAASVCEAWACNGYKAAVDCLSKLQR